MGWQHLKRATILKAVEDAFALRGPDPSPDDIADFVFISLAPRAEELTVYEASLNPSSTA